ncbi:MAG: hypothetical protein HQL20_00600 [Candidatus Omnitrophica bacterium]|nr:hypothetical protein [Candidatus Omnitrophota bacterium]
MSFFVFWAFLAAETVSTARMAPGLGLSSEPALVNLSRPVKPLLKGLQLDPAQPYKINFLVDKGGLDNEGNKSRALGFRRDTDELVKYFLAGLTVPRGEFWVNLSPYEVRRIIPDGLGRTGLGRVFLEQDLRLKNLTASLLYPQSVTGRKVWEQIYAAAYAKYGTTEIGMDIFNKVWVVPDDPMIYERPLPAAGAGLETAYITRAKLKVMLDCDYAAAGSAEARAQAAIDPGQSGAVVNAEVSSASDHELARNILRNVVIPVLEQEVNEGAGFAPLRQVYNALILAGWMRSKIQARELAAYVDANKTAGVENGEPGLKERVWNKYVETFRKGVFDLIQEEEDPATHELLPRKYFSGGFDLSQAAVPRVSHDLDASALPVRQEMVTYRINPLSGNGVFNMADLERQKKPRKVITEQPADSDSSANALADLSIEADELVPEQVPLGSKEREQWIAGHMVPDTDLEFSLGRRAVFADYVKAAREAFAVKHHSRQSRLRAGDFGVQALNVLVQEYAAKNRSGIIDVGSLIPMLESFAPLAYDTGSLQAVVDFIKVNSLIDQHNIGALANLLQSAKLVGLRTELSFWFLQEEIQMDNFMTNMQSLLFALENQPAEALMSRLVGRMGWIQVMHSTVRRRIQERVKPKGIGIRQIMTEAEKAVWRGFFVEFEQILNDGALRSFFAQSSFEDIYDDVVFHIHNVLSLVERGELPFMTENGTVAEAIGRAHIPAETMFLHISPVVRTAGIENLIKVLRSRDRAFSDGELYFLDRLGKRYFVHSLGTDIRGYFPVISGLIGLVSRYVNGGFEEVREVNDLGSAQQIIGELNTIANMHEMRHVADVADALSVFLVYGITARPEDQAVFDLLEERRLAMWDLIKALAYMIGNFKLETDRSVSVFSLAEIKRMLLAVETLNAQLVKHLQDYEVPEDSLELMLESVDSSYDSMFSLERIIELAGSGVASPARGAFREILQEVIKQISKSQDGFAGTIEGVLPDVRILRYDIYLLLKNLVVNAKQAGARNVVLTARAVGTEVSGSGSKGTGLELVVKDDGPGMAEEQVSRIMSRQGFSTKELGQGKGLLGVWQIVDRYNGVMKVKSAPGQGATFTIVFPESASAGGVRIEGQSALLPLSEDLAGNVADHAAQSELLAQFPEEYFDRESIIARLRGMPGPEYSIAYEPFVVMGEGREVSVKVAWNIIIKGTMRSAHLTVRLNGQGNQYYEVDYDYNISAGVERLINAHEYASFERTPRMKGLLKALRFLALDRKVPVINVRLMNSETLSLLMSFDNMGAAHSQKAISLIGRTTPAYFLWWDMTAFEDVYLPSGLRLSIGRYCFNFNQFGSSEKAERLQGMFRQATEVELANYAGPVDIKLAPERRDLLRARYPGRGAIEALAAVFKYERKKVPVNGDAYDRILSSALQRQEKRLRSIAAASLSQKEMAINPAASVVADKTKDFSAAQEAFTARFKPVEFSGAGRLVRMETYVDDFFYKSILKNGFVPRSLRADPGIGVTYFPDNVSFLLLFDYLKNLGMLLSTNNSGDDVSNIIYLLDPQKVKAGRQSFELAGSFFAEDSKRDKVFKRGLAMLGYTENDKWTGRLNAAPDEIQARDKEIVPFDYVDSVVVHPDNFDTVVRWNAQMGRNDLKVYVFDPQNKREYVLYEPKELSAGLLPEKPGIQADSGLIGLEALSALLKSPGERTPFPVEAFDLQYNVNKLRALRGSKKKSVSYWPFKVVAGGREVLVSIVWERGELLTGQEHFSFKIFFDGEKTEGFCLNFSYGNGVDQKQGIIDSNALSLTRTPEAGEIVKVLSPLILAGSGGVLEGSETKSAAQSELLAQFPAEFFDRESIIARLRGMPGPERSVSYEPFVVRGEGREVSVKVAWYMSLSGDKELKYRLSIILNGDKKQYYTVYYDYYRTIEGREKLRSVDEYASFKDAPRMAGLFKILRSLALDRSVPLIDANITNQESLDLLRSFAYPGDNVLGVAHSQEAVTLIGRVTPEYFLWWDMTSYVENLYSLDGFKFSRGRYCFNFNQFGSPEKAERLQRMFRQATEIELAYYAGPIDIKFSPERRDLLRGKYPGRAAVEALAAEFKNERAQLPEKGDAYDRILSSALERQEKRLQVIASTLDFADRAQVPEDASSSGASAEASVVPGGVDMNAAMAPGVGGPAAETISEAKSGATGDILGFEPVFIGVKTVHDLPAFLAPAGLLAE